MTNSAGNPVPVELEKINSSEGTTFKAKYTPPGVGDYKIDVKLDGKSVNGFPRTVHCQKNAFAYGPGS
jgi:hypothetical protein